MLRVTRQGIRLALRVQPRAGRDRVIGRHGEALKLQVAAPPVDGAANAAVVALIADWLEVPRRAVSIVHGEGGRDKVVEVLSDHPASLAERVAARLPGCVDTPKSRG
ncbi:MAG: DUF167 domain-containing protein [Deltaproteobacteria bacterium]|nr:DUF167 domain-containing protein [Deltaproteobacteria bacterium]